MAENSGIEWTHHTFNPWTGCTKVSAACDHCYAEAWSKRSGHVQWGPHGARRRTKTWGNPVKWNKRLEGTGRRERVFCASLADVFDNHSSIEQLWRDELWELIHETPNLDWLLLTKRPQNIVGMLPIKWHRDGPYPNVWLGTTVEDQTEANRRIPYLLRVPAVVRYLSCEPLLGPVDLTHMDVERHPVAKHLGRLGGYFINALTGDNDDMCRPCPPVPKIDWIITGGESGPKFRPGDAQWFRDLRDQCAASGTPFLFKQWEGRTQTIIKSMGRELDGVVHDGYPVAARHI